MQASNLASDDQDIERGSCDESGARRTSLERISEVAMVGFWIDVVSPIVDDDVNAEVMSRLGARRVAVGSEFMVEGWAARLTELTTRLLGAARQIASRTGATTTLRVSAIRPDGSRGRETLRAVTGRPV